MAPYQNAQEFQVVLDRIAHQFTPAVEKILYDPYADQSYKHGKKYVESGQIDGGSLFYHCTYDFKNLFACILFPCSLIGQRIQQTIFVYKMPISEQELLSTLVDHEVIHTQQNYQGVILSEDLVINKRNIGEIDLNFLRSVKELQAYKHQIPNFANRDIAPNSPIVTSAVKYFERHFDFLKRYNPKTPLETKIVNVISADVEDFNNRYKNQNYN